MDQTETPKNKAVEAAKTISWSPFTAVVMVIAVYLAATIIGQYLLFLYGHLQGWSAQKTFDWAARSTWAEFASTLLVYALMAAGIYWFIYLRKGRLRTLGVHKPHLGDFGATLVAAPVYVILYAIVLGVATTLVPSLNTNQQQQLGFSPDGIHPALILTFLSLVVLPPLVEEFIMRGFLFTSLLKRAPFWLAALITSVIFASAHLQFGSGAPLLWTAAIDTFVLSLVLCYLRYRTDSLWPGIGLHALKNLVAFSVVFVFPYLQGTMFSNMILHGAHILLPFFPAL